MSAVDTSFPPSYLARTSASKCRGEGGCPATFAGKEKWHATDFRARECEDDQADRGCSRLWQRRTVKGVWEEDKRVSFRLD